MTTIHPRSDGLVRSVTVRNASRKEYVRPIHKLCLIAARQELENEQWLFYIIQNLSSCQTAGESLEDLKGSWILF